jgi:pimeloyl-ACP methyl ester carboxylesterase
MTITAPDWLDIDWPAHTTTVEVSEGVVVSYVDIGTGAEPALLLIHGLGGSWGAWLENIPVLARDRRVIAVDLPGFGDSPASPDTITIAAYARAMEGLCERLGLTSVVAIGSSLGGWISTELTLRAPDLVAGLILVDAAGIPPTRLERMKVVGMLRLADRMAPWGVKYRDSLIHNLRLRRRALGFAVAAPERLSAELVGTLLPTQPSPVFRAVLNAAVKSWSVSWCDLVGEITAPALVLWGACDAQLPLRHGEEWNRLLKRSRLVVVPDAGHLPMLEDPQLVNREIVAFVDSLVP